MAIVDNYNIRMDSSMILVQPHEVLVFVESDQSEQATSQIKINNGGDEPVIYKVSAESDTCAG